MSAEQFFQVVLLPQGDFAKFLRADAKEKSALLQKLFGTDRFRKVEDWLADRRRASDKDVSAAHEGVAFLVAQVAQAAGLAEAPDELPDPAGWAGRLAAQAADAREAASALVASRRAGLESALAARARAEQLADRQRRRRDALDRKAALEASSPEVARIGAEPSGLPAAAQDQQAQVGRLEALREVAGQAEVEDGGGRPRPHARRRAFRRPGPARRRPPASARRPPAGGARARRREPGRHGASRGGPRGRRRPPGGRRLRRLRGGARQARRLARGAPHRPGEVPGGEGGSAARSAPPASTGCAPSWPPR